MTPTQDVATPEVDEHPFEAKLDPRWALSLEQVVAVTAFSVLFIMLSYFSLRPTDLWCHVIYGQWILDHRMLPTEDPSMPLARGMEVVDTAWLSQVILGAIDRYLGAEWLSNAFAITGLITYLIWARVFYLQSQRVWLSLVSILLLIFVGWSRITTVRPETFAMLCCALLFLLIVNQEFGQADSDTTTNARRSRWMTWVGVFVVFALWANIHGSFPIGIAFLLCFFVGRVIEVIWNQRSLRALLQDRAAWRWLYLTEVAMLATLFNPYGLDLWIHTVRFSWNPNLASVLEWQPLVILGTGGRQFAFSIVLLLLVWRHSRRRIRPAEVLLLLVFAAAAIKGIRMIGWYAPVYVYVVTPHLAEIVSRWSPALSLPSDSGERSTTSVRPGHSFRYSLVALLPIWFAFVFSPISQPVFNRAARTPERLYGKETPVALAKFLKNPPKSSPLLREDQRTVQVFHPQWWGDWLDHAGPTQFRPFVTTNMHLVPSQVWRDYERVVGVQSGWERTLERYAVKTIIVDKKEQRTFFSTLKQNSNWQNVYEDERAAVFVLRPVAGRDSQRDSAPAEEVI